MGNSMNTTLLTLLLLLSVLFITQLTCTKGFNVTESTSSINGLIPMESTVYRVFNNDYFTDGQRRRLAPFQLCLLCKCCPSGADPGLCQSMPCCFGIDCQLPNKPFGGETNGFTVGFTISTEEISVCQVDWTSRI